MSKTPESTNERQKNLPSMSSRQQILYLINRTQNSPSWEEKEDKPSDNPLDYHTYFMEKRERIVLIALNKEKCSTQTYSG